MTTLSVQIVFFSSSISQVSQTAEVAMELGLATQDSTGQLQKQTDWVADKIIALENQLKINNFLKKNTFYYWVKS